ncbi:hypothetical protein BH20VER2_BH20VER2_04560 [soil metagenome]|nr:hypothetical protein [Chthoniobacterales bacterium]
MSGSDDKQLIQQLSRTALYQDYEQAFSAATGMPLALRAVEHWQMALHGKEHENPFCALMSQANGSCAAYLEVQQKIGEGATDQRKLAGQSPTHYRAALTETPRRRARA